MLGHSAHWSPDGSRLGYFDPQGGVRVLNPATGNSQLIPNQLGEMGAWAPDGQALALVELAFLGEVLVGHLVRADLTTGTTQELGDESPGSGDGSPAWSPTGEWIAFGRKALEDGTPVPGQQLWLIRPDGTDAHPVVTDRQAHLGAFAWSPQGDAVLYQRFALMEAHARPEVWLWSLDGSQPIRLAANGTLPGWLP
jgi:Tol biopolymer transport system component